MPPKSRTKAKSKGTSSSRQGKGKRTRSPSPPPPPPRVIPLPWAFQDEAHENRYQAMSQRLVVPTRYFHDDILHSLGLYEEVM